MDGGRIEGWRRKPPKLGHGCSTCMQSTEMITTRCSSPPSSPSTKMGSTKISAIEEAKQTEESHPTPWWLVLVGARRAVLWGTEPGDLRAFLTGVGGDRDQAPAGLTHEVSDIPSLEDGSGSALDDPQLATAWELAPKDSGGALGGQCAGARVVIQRRDA